MTTHYMLFKEGRDDVADTQWFVNHFVDGASRESDLKWIAERLREFEDNRILGVFSEDGEPFYFISEQRRNDMPKDWIEVTPNNILGEL